MKKSASRVQTMTPYHATPWNGRQEALRHICEWLYYKSRMTYKSSSEDGDSDVGERSAQFSVQGSPRAVFLSEIDEDTMK